MMNYDKLIERLQRRARPKKPFIAQGEIWTGGMAKDELCADAVTAIETLRADLARVTEELADLRAQWDMYGGDVGITETFKELERLKKCIEIVENQRDAAIEDLHRLVHAWKWDSEKED